MLDLRALGYFVAIYEEGSVTAAALRCHIAQPSITNALQGLEQKLSCRLFERTRSGCVATVEGERLYQRAVSFLSQGRAIEREFDAARQTTAINIYVQPDILFAAVAPLLDVLYRARPGVRLVFLQQSAEADVAVVSQSGEKPNKRMHTLWREDYVLAAPASHPIRLHRNIALDQLHGLELINRPRCSRYNWFRDSLEAAGVVPNIVAHADTEETVLALIQMGVGAAILPESHLRRASVALNIVRFFPAVSVSRSVGLQLNGPAALRALGVTLDMMRSVFTQNYADKPR